MRNNVRRITDGAVMAAIMGLLMVIDGQSGMLLDGLLFWIVPIPIIVYTVKYDISSGFMVSVAVSILAFILTLPHLAVLIAFSNLIGLAYGFGINKKLKSYQTLTLTFIVTLTYYVISMVIFAGFFGYDAVAELNALIDLLSGFLASTLNSERNMVEILSVINPFFRMLINFPLFLPATIALLQTVITNLISSIILKRLDLANIVVKPVFNIRITKKTGIVVLIIFILTYVYNFSINTSFDNVIMIVQFICELIFISMGAILAMTYIAVKRMPILSMIVALVTIGAPLIMLGLGLIDVFSDTRNKLIRRAISERESRTT